MLLLSNSDGTFSDASANIPGLARVSYTGAVGDVDGDGDLDIYDSSIGPRVDEFDIVSPALFLNDGTGQFSEASINLPNAVTGTYDLGGYDYLNTVFYVAKLEDLNGDGAAELLLGQEHNQGEPGVVIFWNDGAGQFSDASRTSLPSPIYGELSEYSDIELFDANGDGHIDILSVAHQGDIGGGYSLTLTFGDGSGNFVNVTSSNIVSAAAPVATSSSTIGDLRVVDIDLDGDLDFMGTPFGNWEQDARPLIWLNNGDGVFDETIAWTEVQSFGMRLDLILSADGNGYDFISFGTIPGDPSQGYYETWSVQANTPGSRIVTGDNSSNYILGGSGAEIIYGLDGKDILSGRGGADELIGGDGDDTLIGGAGADSYTGGNGFDRVIYVSEGGPNGVVANFATGEGLDTFANVETYNSSIEGIVGTHQIDSVIGGADSVSLSGLGGNDTLDGTLGLLDAAHYDRDQYEGGAAGVGVIVDLDNGTGTDGNIVGTGTDGFGDTDTLINVEGVKGTHNADDITGSSQDNQLLGLGGDDTLRGEDGSDDLDGGNGNDILIGGADSDTIKGGAGIDTAVFSWSFSEYQFRQLVGSGKTEVIHSNDLDTVFTDVEVYEFMGATKNYYDLDITVHNGFGSILSWHFGWNIGWHVGWNVGWHYGWHVGWTVGWNFGWKFGWNFGWNFGWFNNGAGWTIGWSVGWYVGWNLGWNVGWYVGWNVGWSVGWNFGWNVGWNVSWYYGWGLE